MFTTLTVIVPLVLPKDQGPMFVRVPQTCEKCQKSTRGDTTGTITTTSPATQPNVTVANQFTVKLQRAPKASRKKHLHSNLLP